MWLQWLILALVLILIVVGIVLKTFKFVFKIISYVAIVLLVVSLGLGVVAYTQGQQLKEQMIDGPIVVFSQNDTYVGGIIMYEDDDVTPTVLEPNDIEQTLKTTTKLALDFDILLFPDVSIQETDIALIVYLEALDTIMKEQGEAVILEAYFDGNLQFIPEPWTFKLLRTQQLVPVRAIMKKLWFRRVVGLEPA